MAAVKKEKPKKSAKKDKKVEEKVKTADTSVISGQLQKKINKNDLKPRKDPKGIVFIKNLPHGFFEEQLKKYFEQFGNVSRVRLARSRRTGNSKGFAFVEFDYPEVAEVAAETMNNYLMFKKIIKAAYIPPEEQKFNYFRTNVKQITNKSGKKVWVSGKTASIQQKAKQHNDWSEEKYQKRTAKQMEKIKKMGEKFAHLGIDINKFVIPPKIMSEEEKMAQTKLDAKKSKQEKAAGNSKTLKRKSANEKEESSSKNVTQKKLRKDVALEDLLGNTIQEDSEDEDYIAMPDSDEASGESSNEEDSFTKDSDGQNEDSKNVTQKKLRKEVALEDLLGNTIQEDSEDEDYIAMPESDEASGESSNEDTYGFTKDSDSQNEDDSEEDEDETNIPLVSLNKTKKTSFGKSLKASSGERFDQILKRKPHSGGIQKSVKKVSKKSTVVGKNKAALQLTAAKELAKPLPKAKSNFKKSVKSRKVAKKAK